MSETLVSYNDREIQYVTSVDVREDYLDYGNRWGAVQKISIQGNIVSCSSSNYNSLISIQSALFSIFSQDYGTLVIGGKTLNNVKVDSVDFQSSDFVAGILSFSVSLTAFPSSEFNQYNVTDPINSITYSEQRNNTVQITRRISARGINTSSDTNNALENARSYVSSKLSWVYSIMPPTKIVGYNLSGEPCPTKIVENIDRMNGSYSVEKTYIIKKNQKLSNNVMMSYSVDSNYDEERGILTGTLKGNLTGCTATSMSDLRSAMQSINLFGLLSSNMIGAGGGNVVDQPESISINENEKDMSINFSITCNSIANRTKILENNFNMSVDYLTDRVTVNYTGKIQFRGSQLTRSIAVDGFDFPTSSAASLCQQFYSQQCPGEFGKDAKINPVPTSFSVQKDRVNGTVTITAQCDNRPIPPNISFTSYDYTLNANLSQKYYTINQFIDGTTSAIDYGIKLRGSLSVQMNATAKDPGLDEPCLSMAREKINQLASVIGRSDMLETDVSVESASLPDDSGYVYSATITQTAQTTKAEE